MPWNAEETLSRPELTKLQSERLQKVCERVYARVPFYKKKFDEKGIKPSDIKDIQDIVKLPFTKKVGPSRQLSLRPLCRTARQHRPHPCLVGHDRQSPRSWPTTGTTSTSGPR